MNLVALKMARTYVFSRTNRGVVNLITFIAMVALSFSTASMLIIASIFSGLEELNLKAYNDINAEIRVFPAQGKLINNSDSIQRMLKGVSGVQSVEEVIEEKAYVTYGNSQEICNIKGISASYPQVSRIDTMLLAGEFIQNDQPFYLLSDELASKLEVFINTDLPTKVYVPKAGEGLITKETDAFNQTELYPAGVFYINEQYVNHLFVPIRYARKLLELNNNQVYSFEVKSSPKSNYNEVKSDLEQILGSSFQVQTREESNAAFLKLMNTEKLIIYLIFVLLVGIASFNLAGSLIILVLDKQKQIQTLHFLGMEQNRIRKVFRYTGIFIGVAALFIGLIFGSTICLGQQTYGWVKATPSLPFPVKFDWSNFVIISAVVLGYSFLISWLISRRIQA